MTIAQFHQNFKIGLDKTDSLNYPDFLPEEIDVFLNKNIEKFVHQRLYGTNPKREGIEETQKRYDDLLTLISNNNITTFISNPNTKPNGQLVTLPIDYLHIIEEEANIDHLDCNEALVTSRVPVYSVTHDRYNKIIRDPFNKPDETKVIRMGLIGMVELITGPNITLSSYFLRYIRKAAQVQNGSAYTPIAPVVQCDLPESVHQELLQMTIVDALGNIESKRIQIEAAQLNTIE